jgi:NADH:ubiquinone oxidoreductase subunit 4 (subunit M)
MKAMLILDMRVKNSCSNKMELFFVFWERVGVGVLILIIIYQIDKKTFIYKKNLIF